MAHHQRLPVLVRRRAPAEPVSGDGAGGRGAVALAGGRDLFAVAQPHAPLVQLVLFAGANHGAAMRADDAAVLGRQLVQIRLAHQLQQFVVARQAEQRQAWCDLKVLVAVGARPIPPASVAAVVDAHHTAGRGAFMRGHRAPVGVAYVAPRGGLHHAHAPAQESGGPLEAQCERRALAVDVIGHAVVVGERNVAVIRR